MAYKNIDIDPNEPLWELKHIDITIDGNPMRVQICDYVRAKTKQLVEFGYGSLTEEQVKADLKLVLTNIKTPEVSQTPNVIAAFIHDDLTKYE